LAATPGLLRNDDGLPLRRLVRSRCQSNEESELGRGIIAYWLKIGSMSVADADRASFVEQNGVNIRADRHAEYLNGHSGSNNLCVLERLRSAIACADFIRAGSGYGDRSALLSFLLRNRLWHDCMVKHFSGFEIDQVQTEFFGAAPESVNESCPVKL
jgi:hypothetical protein